MKSRTPKPINIRGVPYGTILLSLSALVTFSSAADPVVGPSLNQLPPPQSVTMDTGSLVLTGKTSVSLDAASGVVGRHFAERLRNGTGWPVPIAEKGRIRLEVSANPEQSPEAYRLQICAAGVVFKAAIRNNKVTNAPAGQEWPKETR